MTLPRKLAQAIVKLVVRYASPGCQPWAEGLAIEIDHIPNDWTALRWSLGSTRVLLDRREAPSPHSTKSPPSRPGLPLPGTTRQPTPGGSSSFSRASTMA
jgi:hypothetical protein